MEFLLVIYGWFNILQLLANWVRLTLYFCGFLTQDFHQIFSTSCNALEVFVSVRCWRRGEFLPIPPAPATQLRHSCKSCKAVKLQKLQSCKAVKLQKLQKLQSCKAVKLQKLQSCCFHQTVFINWQ